MSNIVQLNGKPISLIRIGKTNYLTIRQKALGKAIQYFNKETDGFGLILKSVTHLTVWLCLVYLKIKKIKL